MFSILENRHQNWFFKNEIYFSTWEFAIVTLAAPSLTAASSPSPHISDQVSMYDVSPEQVHPVSALHATFYMKSSWIFLCLPGKL